MRVFVSYAAPDIDMAARIAQALSNEGKDVFFAPADLLASDNHHVEIAERISRWADVMVCLLTPAYLASGFVQTEITLAKARWASPVGRVLAFVPRNAQLPLSQVDPYLRESSITMSPGDLPSDVCHALRAHQKRIRQRIVELWRLRIVKALALALAVVLIHRSYELWELRQDRKQFYALKALTNRDDMRPWCRDDAHLGDYVIKKNEGSNWRRPCLRHPAIERLAFESTTLNTALDGYQCASIRAAGVNLACVEPLQLVWEKYDLGPALSKAIQADIASREEEAAKQLKAREMRLVSALLYAKNGRGDRLLLGYQLTKPCWDARMLTLSPQTDGIGKDDCP